MLRLDRPGDDDFTPWYEFVEIVVNRRNIADATVAVAIAGAPFTFTGNPHTPAITVTAGSRTLTEGNDFTAPDYAHHVNASSGTNRPTITIEGKGNYTGTRVIPFTINRAAGSAVVGTWNLSQVNFGLGRIELPRLNAAPGTGQVVEYAISPSSNTATIPASAWTTNAPNFTGLTNRTYYVHARTRGNYNFNAGPTIPAFRVPHTGWTVRISGNITNGGLGNIDYYVRVQGNRYVRIGNQSQTSAGTTVNVSNTINYAPWVIQAVDTRWNASFTARRLEIDNKSITMSGNGITLRSAMNRFDVSHGGGLADTHPRPSNVTWRR